MGEDTGHSGGETGHSDGMRAGLLQVFGIGDTVIANISKTGEYVHVVLENGEARSDVFYRVSDSEYCSCSDKEILIAKNSAFGDDSRGSIHIEASKGCDGKFNGKLELSDIMDLARKMFRKHMLIEKFCACLAIKYADTITDEERKLLTTLNTLLSSNSYQLTYEQWIIVLEGIVKNGVQAKQLEYECTIGNKLKTVSLAGIGIGMVSLVNIIDNILLPLSIRRYSC